jgi:hypothetical protein
MDAPRKRNSGYAKLLLAFPSTGVNPHYSKSEKMSSALWKQASRWQLKKVLKGIIRSHAPITLGSCQSHGLAQFDRHDLMSLYGNSLTVKVLSKMRVATARLVGD